MRKLTEKEKMIERMVRVEGQLDAALKDMVETLKRAAVDAAGYKQKFFVTGDANEVRWAINACMNISSNLGLSTIMSYYGDYVAAQKQYLESMDADEQ